MKLSGSTLTLLLAGWVALTTSGCATTSGAATGTARMASVFVYPVKVGCRNDSNLSPFRSASPLVALNQGGREEDLSTDVNVFNPTGRTVSITYRAAAPSVPGQSVVSSDATEALAVAGLRNFDCAEFITLLRSAPSGAPPAAPTGLIEGFLVIESPIELAVAAIYQRRSLAAGVRRDFFGRGFWAAAKNVYGGRKLPPLESVSLTPFGDAIPVSAGDDGGSLADPAGGGLGEGGVVEIPIFPGPPGPGATGLGIGIGYGFGVGTGVGIGTGSGVDVEYIEPLVMKRAAPKG